MGADGVHRMSNDITVLDMIRVGEAHDLSPDAAFRAWWAENYRPARDYVSELVQCSDPDCRAEMTINGAELDEDLMPMEGDV